MTMWFRTATLGGMIGCNWKELSMSTSRDPKFESGKAEPAPELSRREFVAGAAAAAARGFVRRPGQSRSGGVLPPYGNGTIPAGIRSRTVPNVNGLTVHVLEAGFDTAARPAILLLHGFPELAYSWRKVMLPQAPSSRTSPCMTTRPHQSGVQHLQHRRSRTPRKPETAMRNDPASRPFSKFLKGRRWTSL